MNEKAIMSVDDLQKAVQEIHTYSKTTTRIILEEAKNRGIYSEPLPSENIVSPAPANQNKLRANKTIARDKICEACKNQFQMAEEIIQCLGCNGYYHTNCWSDNGGCKIPSCVPSEVKAEVPASENIHCPHCGRSIRAGALKCKDCGGLVDEEMKQYQAIASKGMAPGAVSSLVVGIIGLFLFGFILGWIAISNGRSAIKEIEGDPGYRGKGVAIAGIIMGGIDIAGWLLGFLIRMG